MSTVRATRDSVCMGDDCEAPHSQSFFYIEDEMLSEFLTKLYGYVACVRGRTVRWTVYLNGSVYDMSSEKVIKAGQIYISTDGDTRSELLVPDQTMGSLKVEKVFCKYG